MPDSSGILVRDGPAAVSASYRANILHEPLPGIDTPSEKARSPETASQKTYQRVVCGIGARDASRVTVKTLRAGWRFLLVIAFRLLPARLIASKNGDLNASHVRRRIN